MTDDLQTTLDAIADALTRCGIEFMVVGSIAALAHGRMRSTHDCDIVIEADAWRLRRFARSLPDDRFYVSEDAALQALAHRSQFNVLDLATGWKVDLLLRKDRPFSDGEFARRESRTILGRTLPVATLEDTIIAKLEWAKMSGGSARQIEDVRELLAIAPELDRAYLDRWLDALDLHEMWTLASSER